MSQYTHRLQRMARTGAALLLASTMLLSACTGAQRSPAPNTPGQTGNDGMTGGTTTHLGDQVNQFVKGLGVPNFRRADTIIVGNVAVIGLELDGTNRPEMDGTTGGTDGGTATGTDGNTTNTGTASPGATTGNTATPGPGGTTGPGGMTGGTPPAGTTGTPGAPGATGTMPGAGGDPVSMVAERVIAGNLGVNQAMVTTAPDLVSRIRSISDAVSRNEAATHYIEEIASIVRDIGPDNTIGPAGTMTPGNTPGVTNPGSPGATSPGDTTPGGTGTTTP